MSEDFGPIVTTPGHNGVDFETRVDFDRLRSYRLARAREALEQSDLGAILLFDFYNIRYVSQTWIGGALGDKMTRYCLLTRGGEPMIWDFGSAARHHQLFAPWLEPENCRAGMLGRDHAGEHEDARADDAANAQQDQVERSQRAMETVVGQRLRLQVGDAFSAKQIH